MCRNGTDAENSYYNYDSADGFCDAGPTIWVCILLLVMFGMTTALHLVQSVVYRRWFLIPTMVMGGLGELLGWSGRLWSGYNPNSYDGFVIQIITTIFSPTFLSAANFVILGRSIHYVDGQRHSRLTAKKFTKIFVSFDVVCLFVQSAGGAIASSDDITQAKIGTDVMLGGIALQTAAIAVYSLVAGEFIYRFHTDKPLRHSAPPSSTSQQDLTDPTTSIVMGYLASSHRSPGMTGKPEESYGGIMTFAVSETSRIPSGVQLVYLGLALSTLFLLIRAIYRLVEFTNGWGGRIQSTEAYFTVLDGIMVVLSMVSINVLHPGRLMPVKSVGAA